MNLILTALISIYIASLAIIFLLTVLIKKANRAIELLEEGEEEEETDEDTIDCPHCKSTRRLFAPIHWTPAMPDIGQCPECLKTWQNCNTKEHPMLKEVSK